MNGDPLLALRDLAKVLDGLRVDWAVGGSVASSLHGIPRSTQDVDVLVAMHPALGEALAQNAAAFFVDADHVRENLKAGRSANILHESTMMKVDLFPARDRFARNELARATVIHDIRVVTAEDIVLHKLVWFRIGGEVSDRQWRDVLGVMAIQRPHLDMDYLQKWATELAVFDLLERALTDRGGGL
jgi:hypothetical protein